MPPAKKSDQDKILLMIEKITTKINDLLLKDIPIEAIQKIYEELNHVTKSLDVFSPENTDNTPE